MRIEGPDGRRWWVGRRWLPWQWRPFGSDVGGGGAPDLSFSEDGPIGFIFAIVVIAMIFVLPAILVAALFIAAWLLLLLLLPIVTVLRVGFGMPWTVVARTKGNRYGEHVVGRGRSREIIAATRADITRYGEPRSLFPAEP